MRVSCDIEEVTLEGDHGGEIPSVRATCTPAVVMKPSPTAPVPQVFAVAWYFCGKSVPRVKTTSSSRRRP
jgi:hypothetical protein